MLTGNFNVFNYVWYTGIRHKNFLKTYQYFKLYTTTFFRLGICVCTYNNMFLEERYSNPSTRFLVYSTSRFSRKALFWWIFFKNNVTPAKVKINGTAFNLEPGYFVFSWCTFSITCTDYINFKLIYPWFIFCVYYPK